MKISFYGAARSVTGSHHLVEVGASRVALDCGLVQGRRAAAREANAALPVDPASLAAVVLSHAHLDHAGKLPVLVRAGFRGRIHATAATVDLARLLLPDSAHVQRADAEYLARKGKDVVPPLYDDAEVEATLALMEPHPYHAPFEVAPGVRATFLDAGHVLGSAITVLDLAEGERRGRLVFTGDLGRRGHPIIRDPERPTGSVDWLVTESTYGDRVHEALPDLEKKLGEVVRRAYERGGRVIVPAFSIGRTQNLVHYLDRLFRAGALPPVPIYVDSPLSVDATQVYRAHPECYDEETRALLENGHDHLGFKRVTYVRAVEESKALNERPGPCVIISAAGTCEAGRILHHLRNNIGRKENVVVIAGFMPRDTLGRRFVEGHRKVRILGEEVAVRAEIEKLNGFSAHADREELSAFARNLEGLRAAYVVHGEEPAAVSLAQHLLDRGVARVLVPAPGDSDELR